MACKGIWQSEAPNQVWSQSGDYYCWKQRWWRSASYSTEKLSFREGGQGRILNTVSGKAIENPLLCTIIRQFMTIPGLCMGDTIFRPRWYIGDTPAIPTWYAGSYPVVAMKEWFLLLYGPRPTETECDHWVLKFLWPCARQSSRMFLVIWSSGKNLTPTGEVLQWPSRRPYLKSVNYFFFNSILEIPTVGFFLKLSN